MNTVPFRFSFEPTFKPCWLAYEPASSASWVPPPALATMNLPLETRDAVTTPMPGVDRSTPAIE